jgi:hypothetical protein
MPDDTLTLTVRLHDPKEKKNALMSASWVVVKVPRADLQLAAGAFAAKHIVPNLGSLAQIKQVVPAKSTK